MCGIAGVLTASIEPQRLDQSLAALKNRGPDESAIRHCEGQAWLLFSRLSILDLKTGMQPFASSDLRYTAVLNGEIYNHRELRIELEERGHRFVSASDAEVVPHLFSEYGLAGLKKLNGIFAVAIHDRVTESFTLFRDRFGVKPLYYSTNPTEIGFASEIKGLLPLLSKKPPLSKRALELFFSLRHVPHPHTIYSGVHAVSPGQWVNLKRNGPVARGTYWEPDFSTSQDPTSNSEGLAASNLLALLESAVEKQLMSDVPVGLFLSGGIDSALVAHFATKHSEARLHSFTLAYEKPYGNTMLDEELALLLSKRLGTKHQVVRLTARDYLSSLDKIVPIFDQPFSHAFSPYFVSQAMQGKVKVALSGDGADELFGNYLSHRLAAAFEAMQVGAPLDEVLLERDRDKRDLFSNLGLLEGDSWRKSLFLHSSSELQSIFTFECNGTEIESYLLETFAKVRASEGLNRLLEFEVRTLLVDQILEFSDKLTMANSIECRVPFLENNFFDFASQLPSRFKINSHGTKLILKKAARAVLPVEIIDRKPEGFQLPTNIWMREELKEDILDYLNSAESNPLFRKPYIDHIRKSFFDDGSDRDLYRVWTLYCFQRWYTGLNHPPGVI